MKTAILTLNNPIRLNGDNIRSLEAIWTEKYLKKFGNIDADFVSKKIGYEKAILNYKDIFDFKDLNCYDQIILHNYNTNFFGGVVDDYTVQTIKLLNNFNGKISYLITDPKLYFNSLALAIKKRIQNNKIKFQKLKLTIEELDHFLTKEVQFKAIFTGINYNYFIDKINPEIKLEFDYNIPLFEFMFINKPKPNIANVEKIYDICYYGNNRGGYRTKLVKDIFGNSMIKPNIIGFNIELPNVHCDEYVDNNILNEYVQRSYSSIVIGDKEHENNWTTARFFENIHNELLSFIYYKYDSDMNLYKSDFLREHMYFSTTQKILTTLNRAKKDKEFYDQIIKEQKEELKKYNYLKL